ncbi:MAG: hypothetical protein RIC30_11345 [Marinoscillum sp.]|uniref:DUF6728 family protein n=1 Tax=Marinoscillum sp. TaxID=2024838 RepID=UPI003303D4CD
MSEAQKQNEEKQDVGYYFNFKEVLTYFFRKKDPTRPSNTSIKMMHGVNKISMIMFLICVIVIIVRYIIRS